MKKNVCRIPSQEYDSKLEAEWAARLQTLHAEGTVEWWRYKPMRLRIGVSGGGGTKRRVTSFYTADFGAVSGDEFILYEVKGHWREAARVRIRAAADMYPMFRFVAVSREKGRWQMEEFSR